MELHEKSQQLLETLANSILDRDPKSHTPFFFNKPDIQVTEQWLKQFIKEIKNDCGCV